MTAYFDERANEIRDLRRAGKTPHHDEVRRWVERLTVDMAVVCAFDRDGPLAFPADLRDAVCVRLLKRSPEAWPCGVPGWGVDYETDDQGMALLVDLVEQLHDLFHAAAHAGWPGRDNPRSPVVAMVGRMEERCAELIEAHPDLRLPDMRPPIATPTPPAAPGEE